MQERGYRVNDIYALDREQRVSRSPLPNGMKNRCEVRLSPSVQPRDTRWDVRAVLLYYTRVLSAPPYILYMGRCFNIKYLYE